MDSPSGRSRQLSYLQRYLVDEMIEDYQEAHLSRRDMIRRVLLITGSIPATAAVLLAAGCGPAASSAAPTASSGASTAPTTAPAAVAPSTPPAASAAPAATSLGAASAAPTVAPTSASTGAVSTAAPAAAAPTVVSAAAVSSLSVSATDPTVTASPVRFPGQVGMVKGYQAAPKGVDKAPGLIVIHQNRGLNEHIKDVTRRYGKAGYLAVAVDLLSRQGGTDQFTDPNQATGALGQAKEADLVQDLLSGVAYLKSLPGLSGSKVGVVGYCFGGGLTWLLAINSPDVSAAVPYYGPPPQNLDDVGKVSASVLAFYGELDTRITSSEPKMAAAMQQNHKTFEFKIYPGAGHAFNDDTQQSYQAAAATDAFQRSLDWFAKYLRA